MTRNYTLANDPEVNALLDETVNNLAAEIAKLPGSQSLEAVLLGGGYGRGEGGATPDHRPYNDLDFFVLTKIGTSAEIRAQIDRALLPIRHQYHAKLHIDVDFAPARNLDSLGKIVGSMMFQELKFGHVTVFGNPEALHMYPTIAATQLPHLEGFRLLLNRGAGLLFACKDLEKSVDFNVRNLNKCILGCHDATLVIDNRYDYSFCHRQQEDSSALYQQACRFKTAPAADAVLDVAKLQMEVLALWRQSFLVCVQTESQQPVNNLAMAEAAFGAIKCEFQLKNLLLNLRYGQWRYPTLPPQLPLLLELARMLFTPKPQNCEITGFLKRWQRFN